MRARLLSIATKENLSKEMLKTLRFQKKSEEDVLNEAGGIITEELEELNRGTQFCYTATEIAKTYGMSGSDLNSFLKDWDVIFKKDGAYQLTKKYRGLGLATHRYSVRFTCDGKQKLKASLVWTEEGRRFIKDLIRS